MIVSDSQFVITTDEKMDRIKIKFFGFIILLLKFNDNLKISVFIIKTLNSENYFAIISFPIYFISSLLILKKYMPAGRFEISIFLLL